MYLVTVKTEKAKRWVDENVGLKSWQWLGDSFAVDHHCIEDLELGMVDAGLTTDDVVTAHC
jgi:hypothetical protein